MNFRQSLLAAFMMVALSVPALAGDMKIDDAYMRTASPTAKSGAAFLLITNETDQDDRLVSVSSDIAKRVELHTNTESADGVMKMHKLEDGILLPAGAGHALQRGGDHIMFMGLNRRLEPGEMVSVTLMFEVAGILTIDVPFDPAR